MRRLALILGVSALLAGCGSKDTPSTTTSASTPRPLSSPDAPAASPTATRSAPSGDFDPEALYADEAQGVVTVYSIFGGGLFGSGGGAGEGSGFVISDKGEIATNAHVVVAESTNKRAREVYVQFADRNQVKAEIVGTDLFADVALLRVDPKDLKLRPLPLGSDASVSVGEPVAAIGSPFSEERSLSVGVVSATNRSIDSLTDFAISGAIQTDAAINPGNSGGPLVDADGKVIGINQQIKTSSGSNSGVGFAVPIDLAAHSLEQLRDHGKVRYAYIGLSSQEVFPQLAEHFKLPVDHGAWIREIEPGGPADKAGLHGGGREERFQAVTVKAGGDVITKVGPTPVSDPDDLARAVAKLSVGQKVPLELYRGGKRRVVTVTLGERPVRRSAAQGG